MFNEIYEIKYNDKYSNMRLKLPALLEYLEDVAAKNADSLGFGYEQIYPKNMGWFLLKYTFEFFNYPENIQKIKLETNPRGANKIFTFRDFFIYDEKTNNLLGRGTSTWSIINLQEKTMLNPLEVFKDKMNLFVKKDDDLLYNRISKIENVSCEKEFQVRYDDIDVNGHVNNSVYAIWALETLTPEFLKKKKIKKLDIVFKKETKYGSDVISQVFFDNNKTIHLIKNKDTNDELCSLMFEWE